MRIRKGIIMNSAKKCAGLVSMKAGKVVATALFFASIFLAQVGCVGKGDNPELLNQDDSIIGRFMREVGPTEMQKLLNSPEDSSNPGIYVNDLLYMVDKVSLDKMITVVQGIGAQSTLNLIYAIKRLGCGKADSARFNTTHVGCYTSDYHYLKITSDLINGTNDVNKIINLVNRVSIDPAAKFCGPTMSSADAADCAKYIEKLGFLVVYLEDASKLTTMVNGVIDPRDVVYFIDQMDTGLSAPPIAATAIASGAELPELYRLVRIMQGVVDSNKLYSMINGKRLAATTAYDAGQQAYILDKVVPIVSGPAAMTTDQNDIWILKIYTMINTINSMAKMVDLLDGISAGTTVTNLISFLDSLNAPSHPTYTLASSPPQETAMNTMAYTVDNVDDINKLVYLMESANIANLAPIVNEVSCISQASDSGTNNSSCSAADGSRDDLLAAGKKLVSLINGLTYTSTTSHNLYRMADMIDAVGTTCGTDGLDSAKISDLLNQLSITSTTKLSDLINDVTNWAGDYATYYDGTARTAAAPVATWCGDGGGGPPYFTNVNFPPLINVTMRVNSPTKAAPQNTAISTMAFIVDNVADSSKMVTLVDEPGATADTRAQNLAGLINQVACVSQASDSGTNNSSCAAADGSLDDLDAAGKKMVKIIDNVTDVTDMEFVIDNVSTIAKMGDLINQIKIGTWPIGATDGTAKVAIIMNNVSVEPNAWNITPTNDAATRGTSTGMGKLVNMIEYINDPTMASMAELINGVNGNLLSNIILGAGSTATSTNSSNMVGLVNAILAEPTVSVTDMVNMLTSPNDLATDTTVSATPAVFYGNVMAELVNTLNPATGVGSTSPSADHTLVAQLLAPISGVSQGVGSANMNKVIRDLTSVAAGGRMAELLRDTNATLCYNENCSAPTLAKREGLVRMILPTAGSGVVYQLSTPDENFPGIGPAHIATMMNSASSAANLITLVNSSNLSDAVVIVGCADHVNDADGNGVKDDPSGPDFFTPCTAISQGW